MNTIAVQQSSSTKPRVTWIASILIVALGLLSGCSDGDGTINLNTINPQVSLDLEAGATYEVFFDPKKDNLDISVIDTPAGITATIEPGSPDDLDYLAIQVDEDIDARGEINIELNVIDQGESTTVLWPFNVID